jgi:hypothetical protein
VSERQPPHRRQSSNLAQCVRRKVLLVRFELLECSYHELIFPCIGRRLPGPLARELINSSWVKRIILHRLELEEGPFCSAQVARNE